jgi:hypothetical protein
MPYIKQVDRKRYNETIQELSNKLQQAADEQSAACWPGHLNYILTTLIATTYKQYAVKNGTSLTYSDYNEIIGMLECCKLEIYRQRVAEYENEKIKENGDV